MGIVSGFVRTLKVPGDEQHTITIRMLSGSELEEAAQEQVRKALAWAKEFASIRSVTDAAQKGAEQVAPPAARSPAERPTTEERLADDLSNYDIDMLLRRAVTRWSYLDDKNEPVPLDVSLFDHTTRPWAAKEVLRFSKPTDDDLGKGSSASTGS